MFEPAALVRGRAHALFSNAMHDVIGHDDFAPAADTVSNASTAATSRESTFRFIVVRSFFLGFQI